MKQRVMYQTMIFVYKLLNSHLSQYLCDRVVRGLNVHDYNTRRTADPRVPKIETASAMNSLFFKGIQTFNMMPRVVMQRLYSNLKDCVQLTSRPLSCEV